MTSKADGKSTGMGTNARYLMIGVVIALAFVTSYAYAATRDGGAGTDVALNGAAVSGARNAAAGGQGGLTGGAGGGCCGGAGGGCGGGPQTTVKGATTVDGGVQKVTVDLTTGSYSPNEISAKAGVPIEITFKGPASSCNGVIASADLGIRQTDVSNGGVVRLPALKAGTYRWYCSMQMYFGTIIVK